MTFIAKSAEAFELLQDMRDRLDAVLEAEKQRQNELHQKLVLNNAIALLCKIAKQSRCSDTDRKAAEILAIQLREVA
jgi:hypothetical protein